jgi:hypothetical protein
VEGSGNSTAAPELGVRRVHDRFETMLASDIATDGLDGGLSEGPCLLVGSVHGSR